MKALLIALSILLVISCAAPVSEKATKVFLNAKVYTLNTTAPWAEAVAIADNKIVFVGSTEDVQTYIGESTETTDLLLGYFRSSFYSSISQ